MTPEAFIIWLEGFLVACGGAPNAAQCAKLQNTIEAVEMRGPYARMNTGNRVVRQAAKAAATP